MNFDVPNIRKSVHKPLTVMETGRLPGVLTHSDRLVARHSGKHRRPYLHRGVPQEPRRLTSLGLFLMGVGEIASTLFTGAISCRSVFAALVVAPTVVAAGFAILYLAGSHLTVVSPA